MGTVFSAYDIRGKLGDNISKEYVWTLGKAFAEWLSDEDRPVILVTDQADDTLVHAFVEGVTLQGRNVISLGEGDEQKASAGIVENHAAGGVLVSHDSTQGIEIIALYDAQGTAITAESGLFDLATLVESGNFLPAAAKGELISK